jgi:hypothetical protein
MVSRQRSSRGRRARYGKQLGEKGLRPVQTWVPDTSSPVFAEECYRQSRLVSVAADFERALELIVEATDWGER